VVVLDCQASRALTRRSPVRDYSDQYHDEYGPEHRNEPPSIRESYYGAGLALLRQRGRCSADPSEKAAHIFPWCCVLHCHDECRYRER
jgi:hypothetical protein